MVKEKTGKSTDLRKRAEERLKLESAESSELSAEDAGEIIHELRVHQVELELQNEELRNVQAWIEESRARYSDLYDFAPMGYFTLNKLGLVVEANLTGARQLGIERGRLVDTPFLMYIAVQDRQKFLSFLSSLFVTKKQQNCEIKLEPKAGDAFFALVDGIYVQGSDNEFCRISISDISERKQAEEALRKSARLNELLLDSLPHPAMLIGPNRTVLAANRIALEIGAKVGGDCWRDFGNSQFIPEEDRQYVNDHAGSPPPGGTKCTICLSDEALEQNKPTNAPEVNAFERIWSTWWVPLESDTYLHYAVDITERKRMEDALQTSLAESRQREQEISALLEGSRVVLECHDFKDAARAIFDVCKTLIGAGGGYVSLVNGGGTENIALFVDSGDQSFTVDPDLHMPLREMREVVRRAGQAMIHNDFAQSEFVELLPEGHSALDNVLFAPMIIKGKTVGLLGLANKPGGFTENDARVTSGFAELAAIALINTRAEQQLRHAHDTLERLVDERTAQLVTANRHLKKEIQQHGKTNQELLRTEALYRQTAENIRGVLWMADSELNEILYVNPAYEAIWGRTRDSLYADPKSWLYAVHIEDLDEVSRIAAEIGSKESDFEYRILLSDGSVRWIWSRSFPICDESGKVYRVAGIAEDITARKQTEESLRESEQRLRFLSSRLLTAQEDERKKIARELHDSIGSSLSAVKFGLETIFKDIEQGIATIDAGSSLISTTQNAIDEVRRIMMDLRPSILDDLGLVTTIGWLCRQFQSIHSHIGIENGVAIGEEEIPDSLKIVIFRIMQEALNNIAKYSKADRVSLSFVKSDSSIELTIEDDGAGFDVSSVLSSESHKRGLGLTSMQERAQLSGGRLSIDSTTGIGTTIRAIWPAQPQSKLEPS